MGSVPGEGNQLPFPAPPQGLVSSEEDYSILRFCDQNGVPGTLRGGGSHLILLLASSSSFSPAAESFSVGLSHATPRCLSQSSWPWS